MRHTCFFIALCLGHGAAHGVELMTWERLPLAVPLQVGQERVLFIDQNVRVGVPRSLGDKLRIQSTGGTLYLRANAPIEPTRLQLQDVHSGELILIDIAASDRQGATALEPIRIVKGVTRPARYAGASTTSPRKDRNERTGKAHTTRETPIPLPDVVAMQLRRSPDLSSLLPSQPVSTQLLGAWQLDDYIVSAVRLKNLAKTTLALDPRELQGDFISATFQHAYLGASGQPSDTTVVYLVTRGRQRANTLRGNADEK